MVFSLYSRMGLPEQALPMHSAHLYTCARCKAPLSNLVLGRQQVMLPCAACVWMEEV